MYITDTQLAASDGASLVGFKQSPTSAVTRTLEEKCREVVSVRDFGATGDGTTDDTTAIQNAIAYARSLPNGELYFPPNQPSACYRIEAPLVVDGPISIRGAGASAVTIMGFGMAADTFILDFDCDALDVVQHVHLSGFMLRSDDGQPNALRLKNASYVLAKDIWYYNVSHGCVLEGTNTFSNYFENVNAYDISGNTVRFAAGFAGGGNYLFSGCTFIGETGFVIMPTAATDSVVFSACNFEQCVTNSAYVGGSCRGLTFVGCRTEGCNGDDFQINPATGSSVSGITITGCSFTSDNGAGRPIILGGAGGAVRGFSITGNQVEYAGIDTAFVLLNGDGESGMISGNAFAQANTLPVSTRRAGVVVFGNENANGKCEENWGLADWGVEQGTFVPVDASGASLTLTGAGRYTKTGRVIRWQAYVQFPTTSNAANAAIGGLPFGVDTGVMGEGRAGAQVDWSDSGIALGVRQGVPGPSNMDIVNPISAAPITNSTLSGKYLQMSGTYFA